MILFRKHYKSAIDDIKPRRELINKIFEEADKKETQTKVFKFKPGMGTALAAVLILVVIAFSFPQIERMNETPEKIVQEESTPLPQTEFKASVKGKAEEQEVTLEPNDSPKVNEVNLNDIPKNPPENTDAKTEIDVQGQYLSETESMMSPRNINQPDIATGYAVSLSDVKEVSREKIEKLAGLLISVFGDRDEETGNLFIFEIIGELDIEESTFFFGRWRWILPDGHSSLLTQFVVNEEITEFYECIVENGEIINWSTENNLLKKETE